MVITGTTKSTMTNLTRRKSPCSLSTHESLRLLLSHASALCSKHCTFALEDNWSKNFSSEVGFNPHLLHSLMLHSLHVEKIFNSIFSLFFWQ